MLSKYKRVVYIGILMFLILPMIACSKAETEALSITEILAEAASVTRVKYELEVTMQDVSAVTKVWVNDNKWRIELPPQVPPTPPTESSIPGVTILSRVAQGYFVDTEAKTCSIWYTPGNIVEEASYTNAGAEMVDWVSAMNKAEFIATSNTTLVDTETKDGKSSLFVEFANEYVKGKASIWKDKPFLLRLELVSLVKEENDTLIMEFKNIDFGDIPDSIFERP